MHYQNDCKIKTYDDIYKKISDIKQRNAIAKYIRVYVLQVFLSRFPPIIVALIPTGNDSANKILALHQKLIDIAADFELPIISIRSDGAAAEFQTQNLLQLTRTRNRIQHQNFQYRINFNCLVFPKVGPIVRIQDPKYKKKIARNAAMSNTHLLIFDVIKLDCQDNNTAYRVFCSKNLAQVLDEEKGLSSEFQGLFYHIETLSDLYSSYISISKNFLAMQTFNITINLVESLVLLIKIHRDYYKNIPLLPWKYGTKSCEHIFGISQQFHSDFNYLEILQMSMSIAFKLIGLD
ncbi:hypothetical protein C1646_822277 [Rhizophagus diaphanus]|nr:hypothetical protein C1646_822277 [Rhizophagus diaphanus] [Rhizophagus sp. MUCL 43196]